MRRRDVLRTAGLLAGVSLAGCSALEDLQGGSDDDDGGVAMRPDNDDPPRSVLPAPQNGMTIVGLRSTGGSVGANAGQLATYEADDGTTFQVAAFRMETESDASTLADRIVEQGRFYGMSIAVQHGVYIVAGSTEDGSQEQLLSLLSQSKALNRAFIVEHDLIGGENATAG